jgi:hypothetical protein
MLQSSQLSIRVLMRLVALAALDLGLFQGAWFILGFPPVTLVALNLNFTLYWCWVRRRPLGRPQMAAIVAGFVAAIAIVNYLADSRGAPRLATLLLESLPEQVRQRVIILVGTMQTEFLFLECLGVGAMLLAGWLAAVGSRRRAGREVRATVQSP